MKITKISLIYPSLLLNIFNVLLESGSLITVGPSITIPKLRVDHSYLNVTAEPAGYIVTMRVNNRPQYRVLPLPPIFEVNCQTSDSSIDPNSPISSEGTFPSSSPSTPSDSSVFDMLYESSESDNIVDNENINYGKGRNSEEEVWAGDGGRVRRNSGVNGDGRDEGYDVGDGSGAGTSSSGCGCGDDVDRAVGGEGEASVGGAGGGFGGIGGDTGDASGGAVSYGGGGG